MCQRNWTRLAFVSSSSRLSLLVILNIKLAMMSYTSFFSGFYSFLMLAYTAEVESCSSCLSSFRLCLYFLVFGTRLVYNRFKLTSTKSQASCIRLTIERLSIKSIKRCKVVGSFGSSYCFLSIFWIKSSSSETKSSATLAIVLFKSCTWLALKKTQKFEMRKIARHRAAPHRAAAVSSSRTTYIKK